MQGNSYQDYNEDYFDDTRMAFGDHIEDLRRHLIRAIAGFCVALVIAFPLAFFVFDWIKAPVEQKLGEYYQRQAKRKLEELKKDETKQHLFEPRVEPQEVDITPIAKLLGAKAADGKEWKEPKFVKVDFRIEPNLNEIAEIAKYVDPTSSKLVALRIEEVLMVWLQLAIVTGFVIGSPWIFWQIWQFIAAGLYPHEKKLVNVYLPFACFLFIGGVIFCYFMVIPRAIEALLMFNQWFNVNPQLRLSEWLSFAIWVPVIFGLSFETPLVMFMLDRVGIGSVEAYRRTRKYAWFGMAIGAGVLTPTADAITMMYLLVPMIVFYEMGILACRMFPRKKWLDLDVPDEEETVEV